MRYLMTFSYDGTNYSGYQIQPNEYSIQEEIEKKLSIINGNNKVKIFSSGRTDKGVHANNAKAHFDLDKEIDLDKFKHSLNSLLNDDIFIKNIKKINDNFHSRFDIKKKEYIYKINLGDYNPCDRNYIYQYNKNLDIEQIKEAIPYLEGTHNFKSFTKEDEQNNFIRTIYKIDLTLENDILIISFLGNGFLRYMIRNMVGTLINIGENKINPQDIKEILLSEDRKKAGIKAPACGLYLNNVFYE